MVSQTLGTLETLNGCLFPQSYGTNSFWPIPRSNLRCVGCGPTPSSSQ
jgi:hypothetical protein